MDSKSLVEKGFKEVGYWILEDDELQFYDCRKILPEKPGLYCFVSPIAVPRLCGCSDILYIGETDNLLRRICENYKSPSNGQKTNIRVNDRMKKLLSYVKFVKIYVYIGEKLNKKELQEKQEELLKKYEEDHMELPPFNRKEK